MMACWICAIVVSWTSNGGFDSCGITASSLRAAPSVTTATATKLRRFIVRLNSWPRAAEARASAPLRRVRSRRLWWRGRELVAKHDGLAADVRADALGLRRLDEVAPADHSEVRERAVDHDRVPQLLVRERRRASQVGN